MSAMQTLVQQYIASWNETDPARRRAAIERVYAPDASFTDPLVSATGWDAVEQTVAGVQARLAGLTLSLAGPIDEHHDTARFTWHAGAPGAGDPPVIGFDVVVAEQGRLRCVYGFFDKIPSLV